MVVDKMTNHIFSNIVVLLTKSSSKDENN